MNFKFAMPLYSPPGNGQTWVTYRPHFNFVTDVLTADLLVQMAPNEPAYTMPVECDAGGVADRASLAAALRKLADLLGSETPLEESVISQPPQPDYLR